MTINNSMQFTAIPTERNLLDFDVKGAGSIYRATLPIDIKYGDTFNIYHGKSSKSSAVWLGRKGTQGDINKDLCKSVSNTGLYKGESVNSDEFFDKMVDKFSQCECEDPRPTKASMEPEKVIGVDLFRPDYVRISGRWMVSLAECDSCHKPLTISSGFDMNCPAGEPNLKAAASKRAKQDIDFDSIITSVIDLL